VDLAADQGGNCALTVPGQEVVRHGVTIIGPLNLAASVPFHASQMYARTVTNYLLHLVQNGELRLDLGDELTRGPLVTHNGEIVHEVVKSAMAAARTT
jgi:NAD(P) transhydrogenase subunit alpha